MKDRQVVVWPLPAKEGDPRQDQGQGHAAERSLESSSLQVHLGTIAGPDRSARPGHDSDDGGLSAEVAKMASRPVRGRVPRASRSPVRGRVPRASRPRKGPGATPFADSGRGLTGIGCQQGETTVWRAAGTPAVTPAGINPAAAKRVAPIMDKTTSSELLERRKLVRVHCAMTSTLPRTGTKGAPTTSSRIP